MYLKKKEKDWELVQHPRWIQKGSLVIDEVLKENGYYVVLGENPNILRYKDTNISEWGIDEENKTVNRVFKKIPDSEYKQKLIDIIVGEVKTNQSIDIDSALFQHDGKYFSCGITAQTNYMGLQTALKVGATTFPCKCWDKEGGEYIIKDEVTLNTIITKLFETVYPIREKANKDEQIARKATIKELETIINNK